MTCSNDHHEAATLSRELDAGVRLVRELRRGAIAVAVPLVSLWQGDYRRDFYLDSKRGMPTGQNLDVVAGEGCGA